MRKPSIGICPEGVPIIGMTAFSAIIFALIGCWAASVFFWLSFCFSMHFFRDPDRVAPTGGDVAASPADGTVVKIEMRKDPFSGVDVQCVSIFMSVFNVHVNRAPVDCEVVDIRYIAGKFFNASLDKASVDNERCHWSLRGADGTMWTMTQIAGLIARRIVCRAEAGDALRMGQRLGMIRFGSRVDLYLPEGYSPAVQVGNRVHGGETIIARKN